MLDALTITIWVLVITVLIAAIYAVETRDLLSSAIVSGVVGLFASIVFLLLMAPDVAITQASIGAGLVLAIFIYAIRNTTRWER